VRFIDGTALQVLTNLASLRTDPRPHIERPQVFVSGTLHGDEWVGPTTSIAVAEYMLQVRRHAW
jgi:hypothetical protein